MVWHQDIMDSMRVDMRRVVRVDMKDRLNNVKHDCVRLMIWERCGMKVKYTMG